MTTGVPPPLLRFHDVELDAANGRLTRGGEAQHLRQKPLEVLLYLIEHRDRIVSKEELFDRVWEGTSVTEDALVQSIVEIRRVLGDGAREPRFVRTVFKRGYQFIAPLEVAVPAVTSMTVEVETTRSVAFELVDEQTSSTRWRAAGVVALVIVTTVSLGGMAYTTWRATPGERLRAATPVDALTTNGEALRLYSLGVERAESFHPDEAVALFQKAIALDPEFAMAHARIGYAYGVVGYEIARARPHIERALQLSHRLNAKEKLLVSAWQAIVQPDFNTALERYRVIVERYPTDIEAHRRLARLLSGEERIVEAIEVLERARAIDPNDRHVHNALGIYSLVGRHDESIAARHRYLEFAPQEANAWDSLGCSYHWAGRYEEALDAYARALQLRPDFDLVLYHRAATYVQLGRFREAITDVQACVNHAATPEQKARAWSTMADIFRIMGDPARASDAATRVPPGTFWYPLFSAIDKSLSSEAVDDRHLRQRAYSGRGARPDRRSEFVIRGHLALRRGDHDRAIEELKRALQFNPPTWYVDSYETVLADAYLELGRNADAAREYQRVLGINARYSRALFGLALAEEARGRRREARDAYRRFLDVWKQADADAPDLLEARRRLARL